MKPLAIGLDVDGTLVDRGVHLTSAVRGRRVADILGDILAAGISVAIITGNDFDRQRRRLAPLFDRTTLDAHADSRGQLWIYADGGTRLLQPAASAQGVTFDEVTAYREGQWPDGTADDLQPRPRHDLTEDELGSLRELWGETQEALTAELENEMEPVVDVGERRIEIGPLVDDPAGGPAPLESQLQTLRARFDAARIPVEIGFDGRRLHIEWVSRDREDVMRALLGLADAEDLPRRVRLTSDLWTDLTAPRLEVRGSPGFVSQIAIRPFKRHRLVFLTELRRRLRAAGLTGVSASPGGETTIDIQRTGITKAGAVRDFALRTGTTESSITYIANEFHDTGNDRSVALETAARCLNVGPPQPDLPGVTSIGDGWRATWEHLLTLADGLRAIRG